MQPKFLARPDKSAIRDLPPFPGLVRSQVRVLKCAADVAEAQRELSAVTCVGLDTESKPVFVANQPASGPHLIQIAFEGGAVLCPSTFKPGLEFVRSVVESDSVIKVGFGLKSDRGPLQRLLGARLRRTQELSGLVQQLGYQQRMGVQMSVAVVLGQYLQKSKNVTTSNWAAPVLSEAQILYAANDAYASLKVHLALQRRGEVSAGAA
jgi:ribonuclease D